MRYTDLFESEQYRYADRAPEKIKQDLKDAKSGWIGVDNEGLTSLEGAPQTAFHFSCNNNKLTNFIGGPKIVKATFSGYNNPFTSFIGAPEEVGDSCNMDNSKKGIIIPTLEGVPKRVKHLFITNMIASCANAHKYIEKAETVVLCDNFNNGYMPTNLLGFLLIPGLKSFEIEDDGHPVSEIMMKHLGKGMKGVLACQIELAQAGFVKQAKL